MALIEVKDISFCYGPEEIFKDLSFSVNRSEIFCLLGPNGCGKTTLLDCILGILKLRHGEIFFNSKRMENFDARSMARMIAYVPQVHVKTFPYKVIDVVVMGRACYTGMFGVPSSTDICIAEKALELVGLNHLKDRPYTLLSGGETQLVMIARALAQKTPVIIMDEPTAHLDFKHELLVLETIVQLVKETGLSIVMATHFPNHAFYFENNNIFTSVAVMNDRRFFALGRPTEVLTEKNLKAAFEVNARIVSCPIGVGNEIKQVVPVSTVN